MKDLHNQLVAKQAIDPHLDTTNTVQISTIIDRQGYENLEFVLAIGAVADADATFAVTIDEGNVANLSDAGAVAAADLMGTLAGAGFQFDSDSSTRKIGYKGTKRYVRLTVTPTNNTGSVGYSAVALLSNPRSVPKTSQT